MFCSVHSVFCFHKNIFFLILLSSHQGGDRERWCWVDYFPLSQFVILLLMLTRVLTACAALSWFEPRLQDAADDRHLNNPRCKIGKMLRVVWHFPISVFIEKLWITSQSVWIFSTIKVNIFLHFSLSFHFRFLSRPILAQDSRRTGAALATSDPRGYWEKLLETPGNICIMA